MKKILLMAVLSTSLFACHEHPADIVTILSSKAAGAPISFKETKLMVETYAKYATGINGKPVTTSVWFNIKQIHRIDSLLKDEESKGVKTDGLRLYFATYPELDPNGKPYADPYRNTVIFVSTKDSLVGTDLIFRGC